MLSVVINFLNSFISISPCLFPFSHIATGLRYEALNILEVAQEMDLTGREYVWIMTATSAGDKTTGSVAHRSLPIGTFGSRNCYFSYIVYVYFHGEEFGLLYNA